jgi:hypothetical protein
MHPAFVTMLGSVARPGLVLVGGGAVRAPLGFSRAQVSTTVHALASDGIAWQAFGADTPRLPGTASRLLVEGQRTNAVRNPRAEGAAEGVPGTQPANWSAPTSFGGLSREMLAPVTQNGVTYCRLRYSGTSTGGALLLATEGATQQAATPGETWTASAFLALVVNGGAVPVVRLANREVAADGTTLIASDASAPVLAVGATPARCVRTTTMATSTAFIGQSIRVNHTAGLAYDFTLWVGMPQVELGAFASTPILPAIGAPATAARGADLVSATLAGLGVPSNGACTLLWSGLLAQTAPATGSHHAILQLDDGTEANRVFLRNEGGGTSLVVGCAAGGGTAATVVAGSIAAATPFRAGLAIAGTGRIAASVNGAAAVPVSGGPVAGLTRLRLGSDALGRAMFGETATLRVMHGALSDAGLAAAVAAFA